MRLRRDFLSLFSGGGGRAKGKGTAKGAKIAVKRNRNLVNFGGNFRGSVGTAAGRGISRSKLGFKPRR